MVTRTVSVWSSRAESASLAFGPICACLEIGHRGPDIGSQPPPKDRNLVPIDSGHRLYSRNPEGPMRALLTGPGYRDHDAGAGNGGRVGIAGVH